jgi:GH24 family phage-related lysozyme (muramidase)
MDNFEIAYNDEMNRINENSFKSILGAGLVGLGSLNGAIGANERPPIHAPVARISDDIILAKTLPFTKTCEGFDDHIYYDDNDNPTIGYGFNLKTRHIRKNLESLGYSIKNLLSGNETVSKKDASVVLQYGLKQALSDAKQFVSNWDELDPIAKIVLVDMSYNLGYTKLSKFENFRNALESLDYAKAREEMIDSKWYTDVGRRSKRLVNLMYQAQMHSKSK